MITSNVKISLDSDTATQVALDTNFTYDVGFNLPMPKLSKLELLGINGDVDITNALSTQTFYGNRTVNISLVVKNGSVNGGLVCDNFVNTYDGQRVRLYINNLYFFKGRLTVLGDNRADALRQLSVTIDAEPLRYSTSYTPNASGLDITPAVLGASLWNAANFLTLPGVTIANDSATISASAAQSDEFGTRIFFSKTASGSGKLLRVYIWQTVNCSVEIYSGSKKIGTNGGSVLWITSGEQISFGVFRADLTQQATFSATIREVTKHDITNAGKSVPVEIKNTFGTGDEADDAKIRIYLNGTVFKANETDFKEYAPAVLKEGANVIAAFVDSGDWTADDSSGSINIRYRGGVL